MDATDDDYAAESLHRAAAAGDLPAIMQLLAAGAQCERYDERHYAPLHHAALNGHLDAVQLLLDRGADVDAHDAAQLGETALSVAVRGDSPSVVELLLKRGANADVPGWMGLTARLRAARRHDAVGQQIAALLARYRRR